MLISDALGVTPSTLLKLGVFDAPIGIDLRMHVDPARLRSTRLPELKGGYRKFQHHFTRVMAGIRHAKVGGSLERQIKEQLIFPEVSEAGLGLAADSTEGSGVGRELAGRLYDTSKEILTAGESDPAIFEIAVLFEKDFGADRLSDMTIWILIEEISRFNVRIASKLGLKTRTRWVEGKSVTFVRTKKQKREILLIPHSLLADIPLANDLSAISAASDYNASLRRMLNEEVRRIWGEKIQTPTKPQKKQVLTTNIDLLRKILKAYGRADARPYDFENDPDGVLSWYHDVRRLADEQPLQLLSPKTEPEMHRLVTTICEAFKHQVEERKLGELLFNEDGTPKKEKAVQHLFYALADAHCVANNLDFTPEPETGRGPADFKFSLGHDKRVLVEIKLSTNDDYLKGLTTQLPIYLKAAKVKHGILVLVKVAENNFRIRKISKAHAALVTAGKRVPNLIVIDALKKPSASKQK